MIKKSKIHDKKWKINDKKWQTITFRISSVLLANILLIFLDMCSRVVSFLWCVFNFFWRCLFVAIHFADDMCALYVCILPLNVGTPWRIQWEITKCKKTNKHERKHHFQLCFPFLVCFHSFLVCFSCVVCSCDLATMPTSSAFWFLIV